MTLLLWLLQPRAILRRILLLVRKDVLRTQHGGHVNQRLKWQMLRS